MIGHTQDNVKRDGIENEFFGQNIQSFNVYSLFIKITES